MEKCGLFENEKRNHNSQTPYWRKTINTLAKFQANRFMRCRLGVKTYVRLVEIFISRKRAKSCSINVFDTYNLKPKNRLRSAILLFSVSSVLMWTSKTDTTFFSSSEALFFNKIYCEETNYVKDA